MLSVHGGDAVGLAVLLQAQLLLVQIHRRGVDSGAFQVHTNPLTPEPPDHSRGERRGEFSETEDSCESRTCVGSGEAPSGSGVAPQTKHSGHGRIIRT